MKKLFFLILSVFIIISLSFIPKEKKQNPPFYLSNTHWADSVFKTLTPDERIAQLFMVAAYSNKDKQHEDYKLIGYRNWINFEVVASIEDGNRIAAVRLEKSYSLPEEIFEGKYALVGGYTEDNIIDVLNRAPAN